MKQKTVSRLSTEAEYKAMADATAEVMWVQTILHEFRVPCPRNARLWCDNMGAKYLVFNFLWTHEACRGRLSLSPRPSCEEVT
jgi:hypothetical protein